MLDYAFTYMWGPTAKHYFGCVRTKQEAGAPPAGAERAKLEALPQTATSVIERRTGADETIKNKVENTGSCGQHRATTRKRRPKLRQLNSNDVNAVFAEGQRAINSLRDVQVTHALRIISGTSREVAGHVPRDMMYTYAKTCL